jgi:hypothetical protein
MSTLYVAGRGLGKTPGTEKLYVTVPDTLSGGAWLLAVRTRTSQERGHPKLLMKVGGKRKAKGTENSCMALVLMLAAGVAGGGASGLKTSMITGTDPTVRLKGKGFKLPFIETSVWPGTVKVRL